MNSYDTLKGPSQFKSTPAASAVQPSSQQLQYFNELPSTINPLFGMFSPTDQNTMLASTLAALTSSSSGMISPATALASVFGQDVLGAIGGLDLSKSAFNSSQQLVTNTMTAPTNSSVTNTKSPETQRKIALAEEPDTKPKGGKIEDIIKRIRDKKSS